MIRRQVYRPQDGLFGPDSMMWKVAGPIPVVPLMLLEAGLLEAPHPIIAYGTLGSQSANDFLPRYHRSVDAFYDWFFGDLDTAFKTARRVFGYHSRIQGDLPEDIGGMPAGRHYDANEQEVLIWVWATIIRPLKEYYEILNGRLPDSEVDRYYQECRLFALLFGIEESRMPATWRGFIAYFDTTAASSTMELSGEFLSRSGLLSGETTGTIPVRMLTTWVLSICALRLPKNIRRQYPRLPSLRRHRASATITLGVLAKIWPRLSEALQQSPRLVDACHRVGRPAPRGRAADWVRTKLPPPYGLSYRQAGVSLHGNTIYASRSLSTTAVSHS
jgi:uncharacterized protein (DUF2236 family)